MSTNSIQAQAERWGAEAKRLADAGREVAAFDLYRKAAEALPGAPWLQHRTAEMARRLKRDDLAALYFRRSADAFRKAGFGKRAVVPARQAWSLARAGLPRTLDSFRSISSELVQLLNELSLHADAESTLEQTEDALRRMSQRPAVEEREANGLKESLRPTLHPAGGSTH